MAGSLSQAFHYRGKAVNLVSQAEKPEDFQLAGLFFQEAGHYFRKTQCWLAARESFLAADENFQKGGLINQSQEAKAWANRTRKHLSSWFNRPLQVGCFGAGIILFYGLIYWYLDGVSIDSSGNLPSSFWEALGFSGVTFTTLGYGNLYPNSWLITLLAVSEAMIGVITISFLIFSLTTRWLHKETN
ncbi:MAG: potassium channel family protein [Bacillota bacterium]|jgi:hypothetical protein